MRILALDYGKRRIGLAVSDELGITAQGLPTLQRKNIRTDLAALATIMRERSVDQILMGDPLHMSGDAKGPSVLPSLASSFRATRANRWKCGMSV